MMKKTGRIEQLPGVQLIRSKNDWQSPVFSELTMRQLNALIQDCQLQATVKTGRYPHAIFAGTPGAGKKTAALFIAEALDWPLFSVDLSQLVSKYIGETEKNLSRIFDTAELSDWILFFDEADALFGKRSEVKDAHDRFANVEVNYLLERLEQFKGVVILSCKQLRNIDKKLLRRFQVTVELSLTQRDRIRKRQQ